MSTEARLTLPSQVQHTKPVFFGFGERRFNVIEGNGDGLRKIRGRIGKKEKEIKRMRETERMRGGKRDKRRAGEGKEG